MRNTTVTNKDFTVNDLTHLFNVSAPTIYRLIHDRSVIAYKVGRCTRITSESVDVLRKGVLSDD